MMTLYLFCRTETWQNKHHISHTQGPHYAERTAHGDMKDDKTFIYYRKIDLIPTAALQTIPPSKRVVEYYK